MCYEAITTSSNGSIVPRVQCLLRSGLMIPSPHAGEGKGEGNCWNN